MRNMLVVAAALTVVGSASPASAMCAASTKFVGTWRADDGGTYIMKQSGAQVIWTGRSKDQGKTWTHQFKGVTNGKVLTGNWVDVPPGKMRGKGQLKVKLEKGVITRVAATGGFGGSKWTKPCDDVGMNPV